MNRRTFLYKISNLIGTGVVISSLPSCDKYEFSEYRLPNFPDFPDLYKTGSISGSFVSSSISGSSYIYTGSISSPFTSSTQ